MSTRLVTGMLAALLTQGGSRSAPPVDHVDIRSAVTGKPVTATLRFRGAPLSVGARAPTGSVMLREDSGSLTTPGFVELGPDPIQLTITVPVEESALVAEMSARGARLRAVGRRIVIQRDSSGGSLRITADSTMRYEDSR